MPPGGPAIHLSPGRAAPRPGHSRGPPPNWPLLPPRLTRNRAAIQAPREECLRHRWEVETEVRRGLKGTDGWTVRGQGFLWKAIQRILWQRLCQLITSPLTLFPAVQCAATNRPLTRLEEAEILKIVVLMQRPQSSRGVLLMYWIVVSSLYFLRYGPRLNFTIICLLLRNDSKAIFLLLLLLLLVPWAIFKEMLGTWISVTSAPKGHLSYSSRMAQIHLQSFLAFLFPNICMGSN